MRLKGITSRGTKASFPGSQRGFIWERETPRMATSGQLTMGVKPVPPMPPPPTVLVLVLGVGWMWLI